MSLNKGQEPLELELPKKSNKKRKGYYIPRDIIKYIEDEAKRLTTEENPVSQNDVFTAIVRCYQKTSAITGDGGPAYEQHDK